MCDVDLHSLRFNSGVTPADLLVASKVAGKVLIVHKSQRWWYIINLNAGHMSFSWQLTLDIFPNCTQLTGLAADYGSFVLTPDGPVRSV